MTGTTSTNLPDPPQIKRIHHLELWVGNALQASHYYRKAFGFSLVAAAGLESGLRDRASQVLQQGNVRFVLTSPLQQGGEINSFLDRHGDAVRDIAFEVEDADEAFAAAVARGAEPLAEPHDLEDEQGSMRRAAIKTYGDTIHSLISRGDHAGPFMPGFVRREAIEPDTGLLAIDHVVGNVELGQMDHWADWYARVFGFERYISFDDKDISTEYSALMSVVMSDDRRVIKFPINEPAAGRKKSQIQEYLDYHQGAGVQHVALSTTDIVTTVTQLRERGVEFLQVPATYYEDLTARVGRIAEPLESLAPLGVLVDRDDRGYLLQLFSSPVEDRPTLFYEIIQRKGAWGFGKGNFKALFESIERAQQRRGNL